MLFETSSRDTAPKGSALFHYFKFYNKLYDVESKMLLFCLEVKTNNKPEIKNKKIDPKKVSQLRKFFKTEEFMFSVLQ